MSKAYEQGKAGGYAQGCGVASAAAWEAYMRTVDSAPAQGWCAELADFTRGFADGVAAWKAEHPYSVLGFGSHPDDAGNDDCYTGQDFATLTEARVAYLAAHELEVAFVMLDGPDVNEIRQIPNRRVSRRVDDGEWRREIAMQAGMAFGCAGYNDAMGY
jgi:hypothetical protein